VASGEQEDTDLLIQQVLLAKRRWMRGECLLNLKELLTVLPPSPKRAFENGPVLTPLLLCRITPNSAIFCQNVAENGIKSTFSAPDFARTGQALAAREPSQRAPNTQLAGRPKASPPHTYLPATACGSPQASRWLVTDMVKPRTLTSDFVTHFPCGYPDFAESQCCKQMVYWSRCPFSDVFGLPNRTKFYQFLPKTCSERARRGQIGADNGGFLRPIYLNRVKCGGSCQAIIGGGRRVWAASRMQRGETAEII